MKTSLRTMGALAMLGIAAPMAGQELGEIRGRVLDQDGRPLYLVNIYVDRPQGLLGTTSDEEGRYVIKPLEPGTYVVNFSFAGLQKAEVAGVRVDPGKGRRLDDVTMAYATLGPIDVVRHVWEPPLIDPEDPVKMTIVASQFKNDPTRKDPVKLISTFAPGIYKSPNSDELYFKGSRADAMAYYVDGVKMASLRGVPPQSIASITVYTGGLPARYGDVTGGIVAIETQSYFDLYRQRQAGLR